MGCVFPLWIALLAGFLFGGEGGVAKLLAARPQFSKVLQSYKLPQFSTVAGTLNN